MRYIYFLLMLLLVGCSSIPIFTTTTTPMPDQAETEMPVLRYLALGDSYTIGESVPEQERWPEQLAGLLETEGIQTEVTIVARTGWTTEDLWQATGSQSLQPPYDLVSLLIGVNNQYRGYDIRQYREQFVILLNRSIEYAGGDPNKVIVLSIPDWGVTPFANGLDTTRIANEIDAFNTVNREESDDAKVHYVDITPISRTALHDQTLLARDGLHPSGSMYAEWAKITLPEVLKILR